jgi:hypothetical protein
MRIRDIATAEAKSMGTGMANGSSDGSDGDVNVNVMVGHGA